MAERPGELNRESESDPIAKSAGAASASESLERRADSYSETEFRDADANTGDAPPETEQIKARIEETRNQMGETIDAIQERLSFSNISDQVSETVSNAIETAKDTAYDATIGKAVNFMRNVGDGVTHSGAFKVVKSNPLPLALIGIGAGLLVYQSYGRGNTRSGYNRERRFDDRGNGESRRSALSSATQTISDTTGRAYDGITDKASAALGTVSNAAGSAIDGVTGAVSNVYSGAGEVAHKAYERAGEFGTIAYDKYDEYLEENPLALGAVALAVGAAVGFSIPSTRYEGQLMGEAREGLMHRAQEAAGSLVDKAKQVASEAGETIKQEAQALTE